MVIIKRYFYGIGHEILKNYWLGNGMRKDLIDAKLVNIKKNRLSPIFSLSKWWIWVISERISFSDLSVSSLDEELYSLITSYPSTSLDSFSLSIVSFRETIRSFFPDSPWVTSIDNPLIKFSHRNYGLTQIKVWFLIYFKYDLFTFTGWISIFMNDSKSMSHFL